MDPAPQCPGDGQSAPFTSLEKYSRGGNSQLAIVMIAVISVLPAMIVVIPVAFMQLPALLIVIVVRVAPRRALVRRTVPAACHPTVMLSVGSPIAVNPGIARTGNRPTPLDAQWRRCDSDVHPDLCRSRDRESDGKKQATYPIQFHS